MQDDVYVELELDGPAHQTIGFVEGFRLGSGHAGPVWYTSRERVEADSLMEAVRERMRLETRVILPRALAEALLEALALSEALELRPAGMTELESAELDVEYRCFSREAATAVRRLVEEELPEGVRLEDYVVEERADEEGRGVELYSQLHEYTCAGRGVFHGPVPGVLALADRLEDQDFVHPGVVRMRPRG